MGPVVEENIPTLVATAGWRDMRDVPGVVASGDSPASSPASSRHIIGLLRRVSELPIGNKRAADDPAVHVVVRLLQLEPTVRPSARDSFEFVAPAKFRRSALAEESSEDFPASQSTSGRGDGVASSQGSATSGGPPSASAV
eukprot:14970156-Alexandrium_andersonii.AAC.1